MAFSLSVLVEISGSGNPYEAGLNYWRQATFGLRRYVDMLAVAVTVLQHGESDVGEEKVLEVG